jgi:hypothetical protein
MYYNEKTGNFALTQPNILDTVIDEVTQEIKEIVIGLDPDYILIADKPSEDYIYDGSQWVLKEPIPLSQAKATKLVDVTKTYNDSVSILIGNTDQYELASWTKQEAEAIAYVADNTAATPLLSGIVAARGLGETVLEFANKIIANADAYKTAYASILGTYQAKQKAINAATTVSEVNGIV